MPKSRVVIYREEDGSVPFVDCLKNCRSMRRTKSSSGWNGLGTRPWMRRPEADFLRDGIHELRATSRGVHYRVLYFFHGQVAAVVAHGVVKEQAVPDRDINLAIRRKRFFETNPRSTPFEDPNG